MLAILIYQHFSTLTSTLLRFVFWLYFGKLLHNTIISIVKTCQINILMNLFLIHLKINILSL